MKRLVIALAAMSLLPATAARAQVEAIEPTFQLDRKKDVRGPLDVVRVAMSKRVDGSLRGWLGGRVVGRETSENFLSNAALPEGSGISAESAWTSGS